MSVVTPVTDANELPVYIATTNSAFLDGTHIPRGWLVEFSELPDELTDHVQLCETMEDIEIYRNQEPTSGVTDASV